jgi:hypothetical protein
MMTEEELRDQLHDASAGCTPHDGLLDSLADRYARKQKRVRRGLIGGSVAATALVVTLLGTLFPSDSLPAELDPAAMSDAEIIQKARDANANAQGLILNFTTDWGAQNHKAEPGQFGPTESWALRSAGLGRMVRQGETDTMVKPGIREEINYRTRKVTTYRGDTDKDVVSSVSASGSGDPGAILANDQVKVVSVDAEIHLSGVTYQTPFDVWLDRRTFLPVRSTKGVLKISYKWLPATEENRKNLTHEAPQEFAYESFPPDGIPIPQPGGTAITPGK